VIFVERKRKINLLIKIIKILIILEKIGMYLKLKGNLINFKKSGFHLKRSAVANENIFSPNSSLISEENSD